MPEARRTGDLAQELWAPELSALAEPFQVALDLGVLSGSTKEPLRWFDADRVVVDPNYPSRSTE